jgi:hypothetical protein
MNEAQIKRSAALTRIRATLAARQEPPGADRLGALAAAWLAGTDPDAEATLTGYVLGMQPGPVDGAVPVGVDCGTHILVVHLIPHRGPEAVRHPVLMAIPKADIVRA